MIDKDRPTGWRRFRPAARVAQRRLLHRPERSTAEPVETEREVPGSIYRVPDNWWGFEEVGRREHPGACIEASSQRQDATLLKGTSQVEKHVVDPRYFRVGPTPENGLLVPTAFRLEPRLMRLHRILLLHVDRRVGRLSDLDLSAIRYELNRVFRRTLTPDPAPVS